MDIRKSRNKAWLYSFLSKNPGLYLYLIGDLDDFFWPDTTWFTASEEENIKSVALLYSGIMPTLLLFYEKDPQVSAWLLEKIRPELPARLNVHLGPGLIEVFGRDNIIRDYGASLRMVLVNHPEPVSEPDIRRLGINDLSVIQDLYSVSYPDNWFDRRMLETGKYFGYFLENKLAGIAGIHVYSSYYRVAALGNIATHPAFRGRKIATRLTAALCNDLKPDTDTIGLNVKSENAAAIRSYENCGFKIIGTYDECLVSNS
jgi:RimJ/RimL family protein N-acetyltransferase